MTKGSDSSKRRIDRMIRHLADFVVTRPKNPGVGKRCDNFLHFCQTILTAVRGRVTEDYVRGENGAIRKRYLDLLCGNCRYRFMRMFSAKNNHSGCLGKTFTRIDCDDARK